jgi:two-component system CheB/CheR fusion protein
MNFKNRDIANNQSNNDLYVVGIGASAGGLDALQSFFDNVPQNTGMAFCVVQHLSPNFKSLMDELLSRHSRMTISAAKDGEVIRPNHIYLNSNEVSMKIKNGKFLYIEKESRGTLNLPIDMFFHSLGEEYQEKAIGVILSGTGTDGSRGIRTIKDCGGTVMVQEPSSAQFDGMPIAAISTSFAEYIGTPSKLAAEIISFPGKPSFSKNFNQGSSATNTELVFLKILEEIYKFSGVDFKLYKNSTLVRRLEKRLGLLNISDVNKYYELVLKDPQEKKILMEDFFIGVTNFFRDKEAWDVLKEDGLPKIFANPDSSDQIRIWSVGCSTGEEAYSLAILIDEYLTENNLNQDFKIFATDIDQRGIDIASTGEYIVNAIFDISRTRLEKYFIKSGSRYQVVKRIREKIVFSRHDIIKDPPFIKMDLITCRNLLIYIQPLAQKHIFQSFQFSLKLSAILFLGNSENLGDMQGDFEVINSKWRFYSNLFKSKHLPSTYLREDNKPASKSVPSEKTNLHVSTKQLKGHQSNENIFTSILTECYAPKTIFIDGDFNILYLKGDFSRLIKIPQGVIQMNLMKMVNEKLAISLRNGIRRIKDETKQIVFKNFSFKNNDEVLNLNITFSLIEKTNTKMYLVAFEEIERNQSTEAVEENEYDKFSRIRIEELEAELNLKQEELQHAVQELETSNEELQASNEELMASNEELQSTNEELQSVNEELYTVNTELQAKNRDLTDLSNDIKNLLVSTDIGILFLDNDLTIRKFTPCCNKHYNLEDSDIGRKIGSFTHRFPDRQEREYIEIIENVLATKISHSSEVTDGEGRIYIKTVLPYVTVDNSTDGVIITFVDITSFKDTKSQLQITETKLLNSLNELQLVIDNLPGNVSYTDQNGDFISVNNKLAKELEMNKTKIIGDNISKIYPKKYARREILENRKIFKNKTSLIDSVRECVHNTGSIDDKWHSVSKILITNPDNTNNILTVTTDITELVLSQQKLEVAIQSLQYSNEELTKFAYITSHDLQEPLNTIIGFVNIFKANYKTKIDDQGVQCLNFIENSTLRMKDLVSQILNYSKVDAPKSTVLFSPAEILKNIIFDIQSLMEEKQASITIGNMPSQINGHPTNIYLLFKNLITNAIKFNKRIPILNISVIESPTNLQFCFQDNGIGIEQKYTEKIFEIFQRLHTNDSYDGTGIGLAQCKRIVEQHKGEIWIESTINEGSKFYFTICK